MNQHKYPTSVNCDDEAVVDGLLSNSIYRKKRLKK